MSLIPTFRLTSRALRGAAIAFLITQGCAWDSAEPPPPPPPETAAATASQPAAPATPEIEIPNARTPQPGVLTGGQPTAEHLRAAAEAGFRTVVDLRTAAEDRGLDDEAALVEELGLRYVAIPVEGADGLSEENVGALAAVLDDPASRPVIVHCASGNRVGALLALKAHQRGGVDAETALELGLDVGLTRLEGAVRELLGVAEPGSDGGG